MVEIFGSVERNFVENGEQITVFRIPSFSSRIARRRARANAKLKDLSSAEVDDVEEVESTGVPGQSLYDVTITSVR